MTTQPIDPRSAEAEAADEKLHTEFDAEENVEEAEAVLEAEEMLATETSEQFPLTEATLEIIDAEEGETEAFAATAAGTDRDAELEELIGKADVEPSLDEILRLRTRGER